MGSLQESAQHDAITEYDSQHCFNSRQHWKLKLRPDRDLMTAKCADTSQLNG